MSLHYADSALSLLRASKQCMAEAWLIQGEAVIPFYICISEWLRTTAFDARRVSLEQRRQLAEAFYRVRYVLLHTPCAHPPHTGLARIEQVMGEEIRNIVLPAHLQVVALRVPGDNCEADYNPGQEDIDGDPLIFLMEVVGGFQQNPLKQN